MIKKPLNITLSELDKMESFGSVEQFKTWFNILPIKFFARRIAKTIEEVYTLINNSKTEALDLIAVKYETEMLIQINSLRGLQTILKSQYENRTVLQSIVNRIRSRRLRKIKHSPEIMRWAIRKVEEITNGEIVIKEEKDFFVFNDHLNYLIDMFEDQQFKKEEKSKTDKSAKKMHLLRVAMAYSTYVGGGVVGLEKMKLSQFLYLQDMANEKYEAEKKAAENLKNK